ncbi:MAG: YidC/Oxa1 family insertase periplasmic-domain containing protein [Candidatus Muiribacteriota bacterium]
MICNILTMGEFLIHTDNCEFNFNLNKPMISEGFITISSGMREKVAENLDFFVIGSKELSENTELNNLEYKSEVISEESIKYKAETDNFIADILIEFIDDNGFSINLNIKSKVQNLDLGRYFLRLKPGLLESPDAYGQRSIYYLTGDSPDKFKLKGNDAVENIPSARWVTFTNQYFALSVFNRSFSNIDISNFSKEINGEEQNMQQIRFYFPEIQLEENGSWENEFKGYFGERLIDKLEEHGLEGLIDLGFFSTFAKFFLRSLKALNTITGSWGISILLLTLILRVLLHPFNIKQAKSMAGMQKIQPEIQKIKDKYKDEPQKMNTQIMELYKKHNMNPLAGCLPMLIQIPILFSLFTMLRSSIEIKGESFLWLPDLSQPDPMYILPVLIALSMYYQQKITKVSDPKQGQMMMMMPVIMLVLTLSLPSGVLLYWMVSNVSSYFQQLYVNKHIHNGGNK